MADEPEIEDFDAEEIEEDLEEVISDDIVEDIDEELDEELDEAFVDEALPVEADPEVVAGDAPAKARKAGDDEEDEDEVADADDVEADLSAILKDRIAAADDDDEEEEAEEVDPRAGDTPDGVTPRRANEFMCTGCFLLVNRAQFGPLDALECPIGEAECPAIKKIRKEAAKR
jgi:hypothetical protein